MAEQLTIPALYPDSFTPGPELTYEGLKSSTMLDYYRADEHWARTFRAAQSLSLGMSWYYKAALYKSWLDGVHNLLNRKRANWSLDYSTLMTQIKPLLPGVRMEPYVLEPDLNYTHDLWYPVSGTYYVLATVRKLLYFDFRYMEPNEAAGSTWVYLDLARTHMSLCLRYGMESS
jgi:hypothetical protein